MTEVRDDLIARLTATADPQRAGSQQAYMKSAMPFHGVRMPDVRRITKEVARAHPFDDRVEWERTVREVWRRATHREQRYAATELAIHTPYRRWLDGAAQPMIEEMIVTGAWWDHVDALAANHVGLMLARDPDPVRAVLWEWATDDPDREGSVWRRRTAILSQLKYKERTDLELLFHAVESSMDSREFFLRKAIGWALREYARTDPEAVWGYTERHARRLSPLSIREARRHLA